jgi:hypothetical protein
MGEEMAYTNLDWQFEKNIYSVGQWKMGGLSEDVHWVAYAPGT